MGMPVADIVVPTYFIDTVITESAGSGLVRVIGCQTRNGTLVPQYEVVMHASRLLMSAHDVRAVSLAAFNQERDTSAH